MSIPPMNIPPPNIPSVCLPNIVSVPPPPLYADPSPYVRLPMPPTNQPPPFLFSNILSLPPPNISPSNIRPGLPGHTAIPGSHSVPILPPYPTLPVDTSIPPPFTPPSFGAVQPDYYELPPPQSKDFVKPTDEEYYKKTSEYLAKDGKEYYKSSKYRYSPSRDFDKHYDREKNKLEKERHRRYELDRDRSYDRDRREREYKESRYRSSHSPSHSHSIRSRSPSRSSHREYEREREREKYYRDRHYEEKREYERRRYESERRHSISRHRDMRSVSHSSRDSRSHRSPSRHSHRSPSRESFTRSRTRDPRDHGEQKPLTDREKILEEYKKNYCRTSKDFIEKMEKWSKEHHSDEEESPKMWYRSSPAELYYKQCTNGAGVEQTQKLEKICKTFFMNLIERGRKARPEVDELPPLKTPKGKMCKHKMEEGSSSSSDSEDECLDEDGLQGYTDRIMLELQRKQNHPRRLHPELWFNNTGEMNGGPLCRCSARARRFGMRHGVYAGEQMFAKCVPNRSNMDKLFHYRITVSPPTNFLIKAPTIIGHDEHEFLFSGFSMFSHYKLSKLPTCKVIRFNIEYTILYVEEPAPQNFTVEELDLFGNIIVKPDCQESVGHVDPVPSNNVFKVEEEDFSGASITSTTHRTTTDAKEEYLFTELLELVDLDLGKATETSCSQFHFMPRFVRLLSEGGCEVLSMCEVLKYLLNESSLLIPPETLNEVHDMDHYSWQKFVDRIKGMIVTYPGKKPCSVRVDQLDRNPPESETKDSKALRNYYPEIVHFGIRPPQLSYAGNPEYQKAWRYYVKYRHLIANMAKPSVKERQKLAAKEAKLQEMRTQSKMKRDVTVAISSEGFHTTGLMCDIVQHAMLIPVLVRHLRFHKSLDTLENKIGYIFKRRHLLQTALTHPSYRENFGTNPDHARNSLTNCGIRQPEYGDRRIHYTRKKGIVTLIKIMSRFGKTNETESEIKHNERLEFLGDAVVEFLSSIHLFKMFPALAEGGLATYRAAIVQNQHLAQLAKNIELEQFMLYAHGSDLCREVVMRHAMANCFEALMGALFLDAGLQVADRVFALALWHKEADLLEVWTKERSHPLQEQEPMGDRKYIKDFEFLQKLTNFEKSIGVEFKHIRLLARAFTDRSVGFTHLTLGSNQRLEFLGDTVLQLLVSDTLYRHFPAHHEGHLSLLRSSLVNNRTQSMVCDDLDMSSYAIYNNPKAKPTTKKHKADLLEAFLGALFIDKNLEYCQAFCNACLFPRLQEFIMNQDWNDPKSKLQQCCLTLRSMEGGEPDIPVYKVIECLGPTNTRVYTVGVYFRGKRLAVARGHSIQEAEMNAAEEALSHELFPQLDHQKRVIAKSMKKKTTEGRSKPHKDEQYQDSNDKTPKAYRLGAKIDEYESSEEENVRQPSDDEAIITNKFEDSGLDSDAESIEEQKLENVQVSSLLSDMEKIREELIRKNEYDKLKEKCRKSDSDDDY